jgi:hypothetical protein
MTASDNENDWNAYINRQFPDFPTIRELCNGSKHFERGTKIQASYRAGFNASVFENGKFDDNGLYVVVIGRVISIVDLVARVYKFWKSLFNQFPQLG